MCLRASLVPIFYHTLTVYSLSRETVIQDPLVIGDCYLLEESRWPTQPPVCFISISSTKLIPRRMTTLLKMELLLCRFLELEYRLPPRDFHPPNPSLYLIPRLYFCCMLITAFYTPHTNLTSSSHTTQPVSTGFIEWASVITTPHDFSHRFGRHPIESSQSCHRQWAQRISSMDLQSFWLPSTTTSDVKISSFSEWTSFYITTLYARLALALWRTRLPSTR